MKTIVPATLNTNKDALRIIDQTLLPNKEVYLELQDKEAIWEAIKMLRVRGAPAIGIAVAFGLYVCAKQIATNLTSGANVATPSSEVTSANSKPAITPNPTSATSSVHATTTAATASTTPTVKAFAEEVRAISSYLATARPTAVNLFWALDRMVKRMEQDMALLGATVETLCAGLLQESEEILQEDQAMSLAIGRHGLELLRPNMGLLTHCNAGGLATSGYGTALAPMYAGHAKGYNFSVYADETRPLLQGARLTAYELFQAGIDVTVICDTMTSLVMREGKIDAVLVGSDRITANGDVINKIGTSGVAILAKEYGIPFYVLAPYSTIDMNTPTGNHVEIELRDGDEIGNGFGRRTVLEGIPSYNPAFDITSHDYVTAIITEQGILRPPYSESLKKFG